MLENYFLSGLGGSGGSRVCFSSTGPSAELPFSKFSVKPKEDPFK